MKKLLLLISLHAGILMATTVSVHEHDLKPDVDVQQYEQDISKALHNVKVPGLLGAYLLKGFKGKRAHQYAVIWIWESEQAVQDNFGTLDNPKWPADWVHYENDILAPYLPCHPDKIDFTDYHIISGGSCT